MQESAPASDKIVVALAFGWGACTFFPVGIAYSCFLLMLAALLLRSGMGRRMTRLRQAGIWLPVGLFLGWTILVYLVGPGFADSGTRVFHVMRVVLLIAMGLMLTPQEARAAITGYLAAAVLAAFVVAVHHVWGLPAWDIWSSLLRSRNNFSSGNMIMMALAAAIFFFMALRGDPKWLDRWTAGGAALALTTTVAAHALSRNAQVLLPVLAALALLVHYRAWRAGLLAGVMVVLMGALAWQFSTATQSRFMAVLEETRSVQSQADYTTGVGERYLMAREAWRGMLANPVMGTGVGSWLPHWRVVANETGQKLSPERLARHIEINNPHNEYLLAGMETGMPGLIALAAMFATFFWSAWRRHTLTGGISCLISAGLAISATINAPLRDAAMGMTLLWLLGASMAAMREPP